jgi:phage major head subunit gpT-like protein
MTPSNYAAWITTVDTTIGQLYTQLDPKLTYKEWSTTIPMQGSIWNGGWTGRMPKARPWYGPRVVYEPMAQTYQVEPIPYELTYGIDRFKLDDSDVNGQSIFWRELPDMATQWRRQPEYELRDLVEATGIQGTTARQLGPDGVSFWGANHPIDFFTPGVTPGPTNAMFPSGVYCNDFTGGGVTINGTLIGGQLSQTAYASLVQYMQLIPDESGEALGVMPNLMMVPSTLQVEANFILKSTYWASPTWGAFSPLTSQVGAADNMLAKMGVRPLVNPWLRNTNRWYLFDAQQSLKPTIWLVREAPRTVPRINENDPIVFDSHRYAWGGWDRVAPAWNFSFLSARSGK